MSYTKEKSKRPLTKPILTSINSDLKSQKPLQPPIPIQSSKRSEISHPKSAEISHSTFHKKMLSIQPENKKEEWIEDYLNKNSPKYLDLKFKEKIDNPDIKTIKKDHRRELSGDHKTIKTEKNLSVDNGFVKSFDDFKKREILSEDEEENYANNFLSAKLKKFFNGNESIQNNKKEKEKNKSTSSKLIKKIDDRELKKIEIVDFHDRCQQELHNLLGLKPKNSNKNKDNNDNEIKLKNQILKKNLIKNNKNENKTPTKERLKTANKTPIKEKKIADNNNKPEKFKKENSIKKDKMIQIDNQEESNEIETREKAKTLEKYVTQINRGEIFAKKKDPIQKRTKTPLLNEKRRSLLKSTANDPKDKLKSLYYFSSLLYHLQNDNVADYFTQLYKEHFAQTFQALQYCKNLIKKTDFPKPVILKKRDTHINKKTLIFDLDETLIHCNELLDVPSDVILPIKFPQGEIIEAGINIRPYVSEILKQLNDYFEIIVFTASHNCYANRVLDFLDPKEELIHHRLFREHCYVTEDGIHIKDLRVIANRNIKDLVIVDNACYSFGFQLENGVPIIPYYDNKNDDELKKLCSYLKKLAIDDIQETNNKTFRLKLFQESDSQQEVIDKLIDKKYF